MKTCGVLCGAATKRRHVEMENGTVHISTVWWYPMEKMYDTNNCPSELELKNMKEKFFNT